MVAHRKVKKSGDERLNQASRADAVIHDFDLYLAAVSVTGKAEFDAQLGGAVERVRVVGEQEVRHIAPNQRLDLAQHWADMLAADHVVALVIDAQQIEAASVVLHDRARG